MSGDQDPRAALIGGPWSRKPRCIRGHDLLNPDNFRMTSDRIRRCLLCDAERSSARAARMTRARVE